MTEHTRADGIVEDSMMTPAVDTMPSSEGSASRRFLDRSRPRNERMAANKIECNACPVLCQITEGSAGACDRYANESGVLVRLDPVLILRRQAERVVQAVPHDTPGAAEAAPPSVVPFLWAPAASLTASPDAAPHSAADESLNASGAVARAHGGDVLAGAAMAGRDDTADLFVTGVGSSTTYPDYKPAPFIVSSPYEGVDMVTVVTEGIFSYCSVKVKIDTDRWLGAERAAVRCDGEVVGHVTTAEYGSQMLSLGGVHHLTGGSKREGRVTCDTMAALGNREAVELVIDEGATLVVQAGAAPIIDGVPERRMRIGCGSAAIGIFAQQLALHVDEAVVVDDHITGVLTEHQAGRCLDMAPSGLRVRGRKSTPGRYFQVANPGKGWGGTDLTDPLTIVESFKPGVSRPGMRLLMTSTTGEHSAWYVLDDDLVPREAAMPAEVAQIVERIGENCEPSLASVLFLAGAGGSLRAGVTENPILLTQMIKRGRVNVTCGGAPAYVWPGGGITVMVDVLRMPARSFGTVPTPAIVAPIEFSMALDDYRVLGGHMGYVRPLSQVLAQGAWHRDGAPLGRHTVTSVSGNPWPLGHAPMLG